MQPFIYKLHQVHKFSSSILSSGFSLAFVSAWVHLQRSVYISNINSITHWFVSQDCSYDIPQTWWLQQQKCTVSHFCSLEIWGLSVGDIGCFSGPEVESAPGLSSSFCCPAGAPLASLVLSLPSSHHTAPASSQSSLFACRSLNLSCL